ncbi:MAG TPA: hypothetical protein VFY68_01570 [Nitrososphaeraceae archaeon]|nr:hypothetical protein [Nitrososphaeraceae archaeon]
MGIPSDQQANRLHRLCKGVIAKDSSIRFAGIANQMGKLVEAAYREGLQPLMDRQETEHYTVQTVLRASTRETFENKIGKQRYAIAVYEKLIRATVPIAIIGHQDNKDRKQKQKKQQQQQQEKQDFKWFYLLISFDLGRDVMSIVEDKILPLIKQFQRDSLVA